MAEADQIPLLRRVAGNRGSLHQRAAIRGAIVECGVWRGGQHDGGRNDAARAWLCRLDTDYYESTAHEMKIRELFPRIAPGGVQIVDDYGDFPGCKKAVDEYLAEIEPHYS